MWIKKQIRENYFIEPYDSAARENVSIFEELKRLSPGISKAFHEKIFAIFQTLQDRG